jgi:hypothetical protein
MSVVPESFLVVKPKVEGLSRSSLAMVGREREAQSQGAHWRFLRAPVADDRFFADGAHCRDLDVRAGAYEAVATIHEPEPPKVLNIQEWCSWAARPNFYPTQYEIMKSRPVLERAAAALSAKKRAGSVGGSSDDATTRLSGSVVIEPRRNTRLVLIKVEGPDPALAAEQANAVANAYAKYNVELKLKGDRDAIT